MFLNKFLKKEHISIHPQSAWSPTSPTWMSQTKTRHQNQSKIPRRPHQVSGHPSWTVLEREKTFRSNSDKIWTVGIYDSFPTYEDATKLFEQFGGGKYTILCISPRRMKVWYYEFEGKDRYPKRKKRLSIQKDSSSNTNPGTSRKPFSSKDRKKEGDEQLIHQITDVELSS